MCPRFFSCCFLGVTLCGTVLANTSVKVEATSQQVLLSVTTDQPSSSCTVQVWTLDSKGTKVLVHDVNPQIFPGSNLCSREGNLLSTSIPGTTPNVRQMALVIGQRTAELDATGKVKVSRSLQAATTYSYEVKIGADIATGQFTTRTVLLGNTYNDTVYDRFRPGEYAYPTMDWTRDGKGKSYIDPLTGVQVKRVSGPGELTPSVMADMPFMTARSTDASWVVGSSAVYHGGSHAKLYFRISDPAWPGGRLGKSADYAILNLSGVSSSSSSPVKLCLTNDGVQCAGAEIQQAVTSQSKNYTVGNTDPIFKFWMNSPEVPSTLHDIRTLSGKAKLEGNVLTWTAGDAFSLNVGQGGHITLDGTDCAIAAVEHEKRILLDPGQSGACREPREHDFTERNWGFLIWSGAAGEDTLTIKSAKWTIGTSGYVGFPSSGSYDLCSPVKTPGPTGNGFLCASSATIAQYSSQNTIFWLGEDGSAFPIGMSNGDNNNLIQGGLCSSGASWVWDPVAAGRYYCLGKRTSDGAPVIFSVQHTGSYKSVDVELDSKLSSATTTIISDDLSRLVKEFAPEFAGFTTQYGWRLIGRQKNDLVLECDLATQNSPAWIAVYSLTERKIISAFNTFNGTPGSANRWGGAHSVFTTGDTDWILISAGSAFDLPFQVVITGGTLTAKFENCPSNPFGATGAHCSAVTVSSLTPANPTNGETLFGQRLQAGDFFNVTKGGADDHEQVRVIAIESGGRLWLQRGVRTYEYALNSNHSGSLELRVITGALHELWVNYVDDPRGQMLTKPYGLTVLEDPQTADCHQVYSMGIFLAGCLKYPGKLDIWNMAVRLGALPSSTSTANSWNSPVHTNGMNGTFADARYIVDPTQLENHPSRSQYLVPTDQSYLDGRPYLGDLRIATSQTTSKVGKFTYKISSEGMQKSSVCPDCVLNYRTQPFLVTSGTHPVADTSPRLQDTPVANFTYCYVVRSGDCWANSKLGELYINVPRASTPYCSSSRFGTLPELSDICVTANTNTAHRVYQSTNVSEDDPTGSYTRRLTSFFSPYKTESVYWNVRATPDNKWAFGTVVNLGNARNEMMMLSIPPLDQTFANPSAFVMVPITLAANSAASKARIRFGYAENGKVSEYYCTSRQVACIAGNGGRTPFRWEDETQPAPFECAAGCPLQISALPGRILYYVVERSADGKMWEAGPPQAIAVPPISKTKK